VIGEIKKEREKVIGEHKRDRGVKMERRDERKNKY